MNANPLIYVGVVVCTVGGFVLGFAYAIQTLVKKITDVVLSILPVNIPIITDRIANNIADIILKAIGGGSVSDYYTGGLILLFGGIVLVLYGDIKSK